MYGTDRGSPRTTPAWTRLLALATVLVAALAATRQGLAQAPVGREVVGDVVIEGNRNIGTEKVLRYILTRPGLDYSPATVQRDVAKLAESRMFKWVRVREERGADGNVIVIFQVQEFPNLIREIVYRNNGHISEKDIQNLTRLKKGMPLDPTSNKNACYEIQDYLKKKGRYFASVSLEEGDKATDQRVVFNITEGPVVRLASTSFEGHAELANAARLRTQIDSSRAFLGQLGGIYNPAQIDADVIKLEEYFKENGYINARVAREQRFSADFHQVHVTFHIHEGERFRVKDVDVEGTQSKKTELISIVQAKKGAYYDGHVIKADKRSLVDYYGFRGQLANVDSQVFTIPDEPGFVRVQYEVKEQPAVKVGHVYIVGNDVTQDRVIRRVLGFYPNQTLRYPELRFAENNLARLNIFNLDPEKGVRPTVIVLDPERDQENPSPIRDILVTVQETQTGSLMFGAGFNSDAGLVGSIVLNERNFDITRFPTSWEDIKQGRAFRGAGQELRIEAVPGTELQRYSISVREPFLFDRPYSLTVQGYYNDRLFNEYTEGRFGGRFNLGHVLTKEWSINGGLRIENVNVSNLNIFSPQDYFDVLGNNFIFAPSVGLTWDTRDSFLRPTQGGVVNMSYEQVLGDFTFPIINVEASRYFTTFQRADGSGKQVMALRSQVSWAGSQAPVFERFFGGGFRSIRGFEFRGVGPRVNDQAVGGDFMFLNSIEYQVPVVANDQLYLVGFLDSGTVERSMSIRDYRVAAGVGLRIAVPMLGPVPIALDFGFPIVRGPGDRDQLFSFWIGLFR